MSSRVGITLDWPKPDKRPKIIRLLGRNILGHIHSLGQYLSQQVKIRADTAADSSDAATGQQSLKSFGDKTAGTTAGKKPQVNDPAPDGADEDGPDDHTGDDGGGDGNPDAADEDEPPVGIIYARVSSRSQTEDDDDDDDAPDEDGSDDPDGGDADGDEIDSGSIEGQITELEAIAEDLGIRLPYDPFIDKAETGRNFDREGIQNVFRTAREEDIDYLLIEKVDRIGRNAPQTLYFISVLQRQCGVTLITPNGERDVSEVEGLMHTTLMSLMAEVQNDLRTTKARSERIRGFLEKQNWKAYMPRVPLGYTETDDGWLAVDPDEKPIVREIFRKFTDCEVYAETRRHIEEKYGTEVLDGYKIKTVLQQEAYIGRPQIPEAWIEGTSHDETVVEDPDLHLLRPADDDKPVSEATFDEAQAIIERKAQSDDSDEPPHTVSDFIDEFGLFPTVEVSEPVKLIHHCGEPMTKAGQVELGGKFDITTHRYVCPACRETEEPENYYRKWPKQFEAERMRLMQKLLNDQPIFGSDAETGTDGSPDSADDEQSDDN